MAIKRTREEDREVETLAMANCLMLLSQLDKQRSTSPAQTFQCKTCNRQFKSFQALGGHRASHKRPKLTDEFSVDRSPPKPKTHECSICGLEFAIGQALGGHMRRHRDTTDKTGKSVTAPVMKESRSSKTVLYLDLNLTPYENNMKMWTEMAAIAT